VKKDQKVDLKKTFNKKGKKNWNSAPWVKTEINSH
jgi:hypothetical protein